MSETTSAAASTMRRAALVVIIALVACRFLYLSADFPPGVTWSGMAYTDEGQWNGAAINRITWGTAYLADDFNAAVYLPVGPLVQMLNFKLFGMSLFTVRIPSALSAALVVLLFYLLIRRASGETAALAFALALSSNFFFFAYSRVAILEMLMLAFLSGSLYLAYPFADRSIDRNRLPRQVAAVLLLALAVLVKTSALFFLPVFVLCVWLDGGHRRLPRLGALLMVFAVLLGSYDRAVSAAFPVDYNYFHHNVDRGLFHTASDLIVNLARIAYNLWVIDNHTIYPVALVTLILLLRYPRFRQLRLVWIASAWFMCGALMLGARSYAPSRYFVPFVPISALLLAMALSFLYEEVALGRRSRLLVALTLIAVAGSNVLLIGRYFATLEFTYVSAMRDIKRIVDSQGTERPVLIGALASTVSIETTLPALNSDLSNMDLASKIKKHRVTHYLSLGVTPEEQRVLSAVYQLTENGRWNVMHDYTHKGPLILYTLSQRRARHTSNSTDSR